jgi:hypothetical protein
MQEGLANIKEKLEGVTGGSAIQRPVESPEQRQEEGGEPS